MRSRGWESRPQTTWLVQAPDILDLVGEEREKLAGELESWLEQLLLPVRLLVCSRKEPAGLDRPSSTSGTKGAELHQWLADHLMEQGRQRPIFRRSVFISMAGDGSDLSLPASVHKTSPQAGPRPMAEGRQKESPTLLRAGGRFLSSLWMERLPGVDVSAGWLWSLTGTEGEFDLVLDIWPRRGGAVDRSLRRRMRGLRARELAAEERGEGGDPNLRAAMDSASRLREVLARSEGNLFDVAVTVTVAGDTPEETRQLARHLRERMRALRGHLTPAWCSQEAARLQTELASTRPVGPQRVMHSAELATLWPWLDNWDGQTAGAVNLGRHMRTGAPIWVNLHDAAALPNANLGVVASSGSGKSYLGGILGLEAVRLGIRTVVLDPENEHRRWCEAVGGEYLSLGESPDCGFNLLEMAEPGEAPGAVAELVSLLCGQLSPAEIGHLSEAVRWTLSDAGSGTAVLSDCLSRLRRTEVGEQVAHRLLPWLDGTAGALFNSPGRGPAVKIAAAVGLRELPAAWVPGATLLVSHWLWSWIRSHDGRKQAIVDEAGLLADNAPLQRLMAHLARRIRKYHGSLVLLTQSAGDLLGSAPGEVMAVNSATMLLGSQHPAAALRLQRGFLLDDAQRHWLERAGRGQFLLLLGSRRSPVQIGAAAGYHRLLTTEGPG